MSIFALGFIFLSFGVISGALRISLFYSLRKKYPDQYRTIGKPSIFFRNMDPSIKLQKIKGEISSDDYSKYSRMRGVIYFMEAATFGALMVVIYVIFRARL